MAKQIPRKAPPTGREISDDERKTWEFYIQQSAVPATNPPKQSRQRTEQEAGQRQRPRPLGRVAPTLLIAPARSRLRATHNEPGRQRPSRTLDLHGFTIQAAFTQLHAFLVQCRDHRVVRVEIITGLGEIGARTIRSEFPAWINHPRIRPHISKASYASSHNTGAVYLELHPVKTVRRRPQRIQEDAGLFREPGNQRNHD